MKTFLSLLVMSMSIGVAQADNYGVIITQHVADVSDCQLVGMVHSGGLNFGFLGGDASLRKQAAQLGANVVLRTSSKATDWQAAGVAYRCPK